MDESDQDNLTALTASSGAYAPERHAEQIRHSLLCPFLVKIKLL